jgi:hypothetical protein
VRGEPAGSTVLCEVIVFLSFIYGYGQSLVIFVWGLTLFYEMLDIRLDPLVMTGYIKHYGHAVRANGRVGL